MEKTDLVKTDKAYFKAGSKPAIVHFGTKQYVSVQGKGDPSGNAFSEAVSALYSVAYALKFNYKANGQDFTVSKLEGLWWFDQQANKDVSMADAPVLISRDKWEYRLLIRIPVYVTRQEVRKAVEAKSAESVEFFEMNEGKCVQILHVGPFDKEPETLQMLEVFMKENRFRQNGLHHEIYLSDFRKTSPEKLKTILREPVL